MSVILPDEKTGCHRTGFAKTCRQCVVDHNCQLWEFVAGEDPNTGQAINRYMCLDRLSKNLHIEGLKYMNEVGAEIHELRNDLAEVRGQGRLPASNPRWEKVAPPPGHKQLTS